MGLVAVGRGKGASDDPGNWTGRRVVAVLD